MLISKWVRRWPVTRPLEDAHGGSRLLRGMKLGYEYCVLYGGLALFAVVCLAWSGPAALLSPLLPRKVGRPLSRLVIMAGFRLYLWLLQGSGIVRFDLSALDALRREPSLIIAANHPSLLDVVMIVSRLSRVVCIMKADIWKNVLLGGGARMAGYIRNDSPSAMVRLAVGAVRSGSQLLIFPEGTRTVTPPVNDFKGGFALVAKTAPAMIQTVFIEANTSFLGKGVPLTRKPSFPLIYRARLGARFEVKGDVKAFIGELENYFREELRGAPEEAARQSP